MTFGIRFLILQSEAPFFFQREFCGKGKFLHSERWRFWNGRIGSLDLDHIAGVYNGDLLPEFIVHVVSHFINIFQLLFFSYSFEALNIREKRNKENYLQSTEPMTSLYFVHFYLYFLSDKIELERDYLFSENLAKHVLKTSIMIPNRLFDSY